MATKVVATENSSQPPKSRKKCYIIAGVVFVLIAAGAGIGVWLALKGGSDDDNSNNSGVNVPVGQASNAPVGIVVQTSPDNFALRGDLSVVEQESSSSRRRRADGFPFTSVHMKSRVARAYTDAGTAYSSFIPRTRVWIEALQEVQQIEMIMCYINQFGNQHFPTSTGYKASINGQNCEQQSGDSSSSSTSLVNAYITTKFEKYDHISFQLVEAYMDLDGPQAVAVKINITQGPGNTTETRKKIPYGLFEMSWKLFPDDSPQQLGQGSLRAIYDKSINQTLLQLLDEELDHGPQPRKQKSQITVKKSLDGVSGQAQITRGGGDKTFEVKVGYNAQRVLVLDRKEFGDKCFDTSNFVHRSHRYVMFHTSNGTEVKAMSGFPFKKVNATGTFYGYAQGEFASFGRGEEVQDGEVVQKMEPGREDSGNTTSITINVVGGVLYSFSSTSEHLNTTSGVDMFSWELRSQVANISGCGHEAIVRYNTSVIPNRFIIVGCRTKQWTTKFFSESNWVDATFQDNWRYIFSRDRNTVVIWVSGELSVTFTTSTKVSPNSQSSNIDFVCYKQCLKSNFTSQNDAFLSTTPSENDPATWIRYSFNKDTNRLVDANGTHVYYASGSGSRHDWVSMGLFKLSDISGKANLSDVLAGGALEWKYFANEKSLIYSYSNGTTISLDKRIRFNYKHTTANDANGKSKLDGVSFMLEYGGPGNLFGIPGEFVGKGERQRYSPKFSLKDGAVVGPNDAYAVRPTFIEKLMSKLKMKNCTDDPDLASVKGLSLPKLDQFLSINAVAPSDFATSKPAGSDAWPTSIVEGALASDTAA